MKAVKQNPSSTTSDKATPSRSGPIKKENIGAQYRHHPLRARRRPPKGMHLEQSDIMSLSASQDAGVLTIRQLDTQLVSLKRQVWFYISPTDLICAQLQICAPTTTLSSLCLSQVQSIKQSTSSLKQSINEGVDTFRPAEVNLFVCSPGLSTFSSLASLLPCF